MTALDTTAAWLLTYALHSTLLLGGAWLAGWAARRLGNSTPRPATESLLWKVALVGGIVTATAQSALGVRPAGSFSLGAAPQVEREVTAAPAIGTETAVDRLVRDLAGTESSAEIESALRTEAPHPALGPSGTPSAPPARSARSALVVIWAALAALLILWYAGRRLILVGRLGDRRTIAEGPLPQLLQDLLERAGVRRRIRLTTSATISSPVALGSGEICLPGAALVELDPEQQRAMLAHELAHLVRRDPQWLALVCLVERAFFFQPLNRLARRRMVQSAEYLADEWAAGRSGRVPLARCLVKVAEWIQASPLGVPVAGMAEERSELSARVTRLLEAGAAGRGVPRWAGGVLAAATLAAVVAFAPGGMTAIAGIPLDESPVASLGEVALDVADDESFAADPALHPQEGPMPEARPMPKPATGASGTNAGEDTTVVRALIARLRDDDAGVRQAAAEALGRIGNPIAIPDLVRTLEDAEPEVRHAALGALSQFEKGVPAAPIRKLLASEDADTRQEAASMLGGMRDRESVTAIARLVRDPDPDVRQQALDALAEIGDAAAGAAVLGALTDENADVRHSAFHTLEHLKVEVPAAALSRGLADENPDVRIAAAELASERRLTVVVPDLARLLSDPNAQVRQTAAEALSEMSGDPARAALRGALTHSDPKVRRIAVEYFGEESDQ